MENQKEILKMLRKKQNSKEYKEILKKEEEQLKKKEEEELETVKEFLKKHKVIDRANELFLENCSRIAHFEIEFYSEDIGEYLVLSSKINYNKNIIKYFEKLGYNLHLYEEYQKKHRFRVELLEVKKWWQIWKYIKIK
jgi:hypothetical protein